MRGPKEAPDQYSQLECGHPRAPGKWEGDLSAVHVPPPGSMRTNREEIYATRRFTGHRSSDVPQRDRIYRGGLVPAEFVRDQWGRMVKQLFSRWQVEADCMASNEKHCVN